MENSEKKIIKVELTGKDEGLFDRLKGRLMDAMDRLLDAPIDFEKGTTVREESKKLTSLTLQFAEEKLKKPAIENYVMLAEIEEKYANVEKTKAETRKIIAEAKKMEFEQRIKETTLVLRTTKAMIIGQEGEEAILLMKQVDAFMQAIEDIKESQKLLE